MNPTITIHRSFTFEAAHRLPWHQGKCFNLHGHTYKLGVFVACSEENLNEQTNVVMDFSDISRIVEDQVLSKFDHHVINDILENPTAENMVRWIWNQLAPLIDSPSHRLKKLRLYEEVLSESFAEYEM